MLTEQASEQTTSIEHEAMRGGWVMPGLRIGGDTLPVVFFRSSGQFVALLPGGTTAVRAHLWADLEALARGKIAVARTRLAIEFIASDTGRRGIAIGEHPTSRHPLVRWADGHTVTYQGTAIPLRPDTDTEELDRLRAAVSTADTALRRFLEDHQLGLSIAGIVRRALDAVPSTPGVP